MSIVSKITEVDHLLYSRALSRIAVGLNVSEEDVEELKGLNEISSTKSELRAPFICLLVIVLSLLMARQMKLIFIFGGSLVFKFLCFRVIL